jgi:autotransporter translocation and assembly factor TamB
VTWTTALVVAVVLFSDLPVERRVVTCEVNERLAPLFKGKIVLENIGTLHVGGVAAVDARVLAPDGTTVITVRGLRAHIAPMALLASALTRGELRIDFFDVAAQSVEASVEAAASGQLKIQTAFVLADPSPTATSAPGASWRPHLEFSRITVQHARVYGPLAAAMVVDADLDALQGALQVLPNRTTVDVVHVELKERGVPFGTKAHGTLSLHLRIATGRNASAPIGADASFVGDVDVRGVAATVHTEAHGDLAQLRVTALAGFRSGQLDAHGTMTVDGKLAGDLVLDLNGIDVREFAPTAPHSNLALHAGIQVDTNADGLLSGLFHLDVPAGGRLADQFLPGARFRGHAEEKAGDGGFDVSARGIVSEPGAPVDVRVDARTGRPVPVVTFVASTRIDRLSDLKRAGGLGSGRVRARLAGTMTLSETPSLEARLDADLAGLARGSLHVDRATITARAFGLLSAPVLRATMDLSRGATEVHARVENVHGGAGSLDVEGLSISGLGEPVRAAVHIRSGGFTVRAKSNGLDLKRIGDLFGIEDSLRRGRVAFAIDLSETQERVDGTVAVDVDDFCIGPVDGLTGKLRASVAGRRMKGSMNAAAAGVGTLRVAKFDLEVGGKEPLGLASWPLAWGSLDVEGQADLAKVAAWLPPDTLAVGAISGQLALQGHIGRATASSLTPDLALTLKTSNLILASGAERGPVETGGARAEHVAAASHALLPAFETRGSGPPQRPGWQMAGHDLAIDISSNGRTGLASLSVRWADKHGPLASLEAKSGAIPYRALLAAHGGAAERMLNVPFNALLTVPSRPLADWPDLLRPPLASAVVGATISVDGTLREPRVEAQCRVRALAFGDAPRLAPLDLDAAVTYDGAVADATLDVSSPLEKVLHVNARVNVNVADLVTKRALSSTRAGSMKATLTHFPLEWVAPLAAQRLHGSVSGSLELTDWHKDARANTALDVVGLGVGDAEYGAGRLTLAFDGRVLRASLRLDQKRGFAVAKATCSVLWGVSTSPSVDRSGPMNASFRARSFRAAVFGPLLQSTADELDGAIDADIEIASLAGQKPRIQGTIAWTDGLIELIAPGQELRAVNAKVTFTPDGIVRLENASAWATTGKLSASGLAHLDGLSLVDADGSLRIAKKDAMPVDWQGSSLGTASGLLRIKVTTTGDRKAMNLDVDVSTLDVELPEASTRSVQDLGDPPPQVHVGVYESPHRFVVLSIDGPSKGARLAPRKAPRAPPWAVVVRLGPDVEIRRGTALTVRLDGLLTAKIAEETTLTGQIRVLGGKLDVQGKSFEIETGTVTFVGDPSNPIVAVTAWWTAEDGTRVIASYLGPLRTGKVTLRSEPARSQNEIAALVLFGTADGSETTPYATPSADAATRAETAVGGFATTGLSQGLDKLTGIAITAKIGTDQSNARPEVAVQVAKNISVQLAFVLGTVPLGTNPDTTYATFDWRFLQSWSLAATIGDWGSSIADVLWQHRY